MLFLLFTAGCVGPAKSLYPPAPGETARTVYVVNHGGRHTGIAVERADIPPNLWPANHDYPNARHLEVGWGDDDGYRKDLTTSIVVKALVWSTRTVLLLDGFTNSLAENFDDPRYTIIEIKLSQRGFERLWAYRVNLRARLRGPRHPVSGAKDWPRRCPFRSRVKTAVEAGRLISRPCSVISNQYSA